MWTFETRWSIQAFGLVCTRHQQSAATSRDICESWNAICLCDWVVPPEANQYIICCVLDAGSALMKSARRLRKSIGKEKAI
jgi:hypothetical protein